MIRRAGPADLAELMVLIREFRRIDRHPHDEDGVRRALWPLLDGDEVGQVWLIAGDPGEVAGYAVVTWGYSLESGGRDALLDEIYVRDRGQGVGSAAMPEILHACRLAGAARMFLETEAHNTTVRRFYAKHGFTAEDSIWMSRDL